MKSITKALNILELFLDNKDEIVLGDIAKSTGLEKTNVCRIVSVLTAHGFLKQPKKRGKYSLGVRFLDMGGALRNRDESGDGGISYIYELFRLLGETVAFVEWEGSRGLPSKAFDYSFSLKVTPVDWQQAPLHCTCLGKILLISMSGEELNKYYKSNSFEKYTPNTITDIDKLKAHLSIIKREGIAFDNEERTLGISGLAAAVRNKEGETTGAIYVIGPLLFV